MHPELEGVWEALASMRRRRGSAMPKAEQPEGITATLLPFQLEGLQWLQSQEKLSLIHI